MRLRVGEREGETQGRVTTLLGEISSTGDEGWASSVSVSRIGGREGWISGDGLGVADWVRA